MRLNWKIEYGLVAIVLSIVVLVMSAGDAIGFMKTPIKLETPDQVRSLKEGDHVTFDVKMVCDCLISQTTTTTKNGKVESSKESARYYVIPFVDFTTIDEYDLTVKVPSDLFDKAEAGYKAFEALYYDGKQPTEVLFTVDGLIKAMNDEEKKYVSSEYDNYMAKIYVNDSKKSSSLIMAGLGLLFLVVGIVLIILFILSKKKEKERLAELQASNPNYYQAPQNVSFNNGAAPFVPGAAGAAFQAPTQDAGNFNEQAPAQIPGNNFSGNFNEVAPSSNPDQYVDSTGNSTQFNEVSNDNNQQ